MASPVTDSVVMSPNPVTEVLLFHLFSSNKSLTQSQILGAQSVPPDRTYFLPGGWVVADLRCVSPETTVQGRTLPLRP